LKTFGLKILKVVVMSRSSMTILTGLQSARRLFVKVDEKPNHRKKAS